MRYISKSWLLLWTLLFSPLAFAEHDNTQATEPEFSQQELDQMLAPIALYPDALLSQVLQAATYPLEVVQAARWSRAHPELKGDDAVKAAEENNWDPSVISLTAFPQILAQMDDDLEWTERLGDAFLAQQTEVMDTVQGLRQRARAAGNLQSTEQIRVEPQGQTIVIVQAAPQVVYVPYYNPTVVYGPWWWDAYPPVYWNPWPGYYYSGLGSGFYFGSGITIGGGFFYSNFDWRRRHVHIVNVNNYYYRNYYNRHPHSNHYYRNRTDNNSYDSRKRGDQAGNADNSRVNDANRVWRHDPSHRRGVAYRDAASRQQFGRANLPTGVRSDQQNTAPAVQRMPTQRAPQTRAIDNARSRPTDNKRPLDNSVQSNPASNTDSNNGSSSIERNSRGNRADRHNQSADNPAVNRVPAQINPAQINTEPAPVSPKVSPALPGNSSRRENSNRMEKQMERQLDKSSESSGNKPAVVQPKTDVRATPPVRSDNIETSKERRGSGQRLDDGQRVRDSGSSNAGANNGAFRNPGNNRGDNGRADDGNRSAQRGNEGRGNSKHNESSGNHGGR